MRGIKMKKIDISTPKYPNSFALVDDSDYAEINKDKWSKVKPGKGSTFYTIKGKGVNRRWMHFAIIGGEPGMEIDHKDGNGLNNQRSNLRLCTHAQNMQNRPMLRTNKSGYKGVSWAKCNNKWTSCIGVEGKTKHLGYFTCLLKAAKAYDKAAKKYYGEFASLNFK
jgi:hypothetical protein